MTLEKSDEQIVIKKEYVWENISDLLVFIFNKIDVILNNKNCLKLQLAIQKELNFYNKIISWIKVLYDTNKENVILFDLDETILQNIDWIDNVRPIFFKLIQDLRVEFKGIKIWILTGRWEKNIKKQLQNGTLSHIQTLFDQDYIFSSRNSEQNYIYDELFPPSNFPWHIQKVNAIYDLKNINLNTKFILIDDQADEFFEKLWLWLVIWREEFFVFWELIWISK